MALDGKLVISWHDLPQTPVSFAEQQEWIEQLMYSRQPALDEWCEGTLSRTTASAPIPTAPLTRLLLSHSRKHPQWLQPSHTQTPSPKLGKKRLDQEFVDMAELVPDTRHWQEEDETSPATNHTAPLTEISEITQYMIRT